MSDIVWGEPIPIVDGKRPEWLDRDELILCNGPRVASSNLWAATMSFRLPADHPHYAKPDDWQPDARTVMACIEALPPAFLMNPMNMEARREREEARAALEALLPKPDAAKALVEEWYDWRCDYMGCDRGGLIKGPEMGNAEAFARWLIDTGRIKG